MLKELVAKMSQWQREKEEYVRAHGGKAATRVEALAATFRMLERAKMLGAAAKAALEAVPPEVEETRRAKRECAELCLAVVEPGEWKKPSRDVVEARLRGLLETTGRRLVGLEHAAKGSTARARRYVRRGVARLQSDVIGPMQRARRDLDRPKAVEVVRARQLHERQRREAEVVRGLDDMGVPAMAQTRAQKAQQAQQRQHEFEAQRGLAQEAEVAARQAAEDAGAAAIKAKAKAQREAEATKSKVAVEAGRKVQAARERGLRERQLVFMKEMHLAYGHEGATKLNARERAGEFGEFGRQVTAEELDCDSCRVVNAEKAARSKTPRAVVNKVLHHFQVDTYFPGDECKGDRNRDGFKVVIGYVCRATSWRFFYFARDKSQASVLKSLRALEREVKKLESYVLKKHGYLPEVSVFDLDGGSEQTTTFGGTQSAVDVHVLAQNIARVFSVRSPHRHGKIESTWKVMSRKVGAALLESGLREAHWFDAVAWWVWSSNHTSGAANTLEPSKSPMWTIGGDELVTPRRRRYARLKFGQPVWLYTGNEMTLEGEWNDGDKKTPRFGCRSVLIGYGSDADGLRVISLAQRKIVTSLNVYAPAGGLAPVRDLVTSFRRCPFTSGEAGHWIWSVYKREPRAKMAAKGKKSSEGEIFDELDAQGRPRLLRNVAEVGEEPVYVEATDGGFDGREVGGDSVGAVGAAGPVGAVGAAHPHEAVGESEAEELRGDDELESLKKRQREERKALKAREKQDKKLKAQLKAREKRIEEESAPEEGGAGGDDGDGKFELSVGAEEFVPPAFREGAATTIGSSAGADSREVLREPGETAPVGAGSRRTKKRVDGSGDRKFGSEMTKEAARALANEAREKMLDVQFDEGHSKTGMSGERYDRYKSLTKMQEILDAEKTPLTYGNGRTETVMLRGDLQHDVEKGIAMIKSGAGGYLAAAAMFEEAPARRGVQKLMDAGVIEHDDEWYGAAKGWGRGSEVPSWYAMAAKARAMVVIDGMVEPISLRQATTLAEWPSWMESIQREVQGLLKQGTWEEVDRSEAVEKGAKVIGSHFIFKVKVKEVEGRYVLDKLKSRLVYGGHLSRAGVDHWETAAYTASPKSIRTLMALAARSGDRVVSYDVTSAFTFSRVEEGVEMYMELPELLGASGGTAPGEYERCGSGRGAGKVAKLRSYLYGHPSASRAFAREVSKLFDTPEMRRDGARSLVSDRMSFRWKWGGETMNVCVWVDDFVCSCSGTKIQREFERRLEAFFGEGRVTGGEEVEYVLGMSVERDLQRKTLKISQGGFVRQMLERLGLPEAVNTRMSPMQGGTHLKKNEGRVVPKDEWDMQWFVGCCQWLAISTRPDIAEATGKLARHVNNVGEEHVAAAKWLMRYLAGTADMGITYHGSDEYLVSNGYDRRDKLIASVDSDLGGCEDTSRSTTGLVVMLNGGAVSWASKRQTTVSQATLIAEMKAAGQAALELQWMRDLLTELGKPQGCVRVMEDNAGCCAVAHGQKDTTRTQHIRRVCRYVEDACGRGVIWLDDVPGVENWADIFTKSVAPIEQFEKLRDIVMGTKPDRYVSPTMGDIIRKRECEANKLLTDALQWLDGE